MGTVEERLASLETRMDAFADFRADTTRRFTELRGDMNRQFAELRTDMNRQFADVNRQFTELRDDMNRRFVALDEKGDRHFTWLVGTQVGVLLAVVGALVGTYYR